MRLSVDAILDLLLVMPETRPLNSASEIAILSSISLRLNLSLSGHIFQIRAVDAVGLRVVAWHACLCIMRKLTRTVGRVGI